MSTVYVVVIYDVPEKVFKTLESAEKYFYKLETYKSVYSYIEAFKVEE